MDYHKDKIFLMKNFIKRKTFIFHEIFQRIVGKAELPGKIKFAAISVSCIRTLFFAINIDSRV